MLKEEKLYTKSPPPPTTTTRHDMQHEKRKKIFLGKVENFYQVEKLST